MKIRINKYLILENVTNKKNRFIIIKGNPKYKINISAKFYKDIEKIALLNNYNVEFYESDIWADEIKDYKKLSKKDIVLGFSRGCWYADILKNKLKIKTNFIGIGCGANEYQDNYIINKNDKTPDGKLSGNSLIAHWTLSNDMITELKKLLLKI